MNLKPCPERPPRCARRRSLGMAWGSKIVAKRDVPILNALSQIKTVRGVNAVVCEGQAAPHINTRKPDQAAQHGKGAYCLQVGSVREALAALQQVQQGVGHHQPSLRRWSLWYAVWRTAQGKLRGCRLLRPAGGETFPTEGRQKNAQALHLGEGSKTVGGGLRLFRRVPQSRKATRPESLRDREFPSRTCTR